MNSKTDSTDNNQPGTTAEPATVWTGKPIPKPTKKQQAFIQHLIEHPKESATKAVQATYGKEGKPVTYGSARAIASENLTKPSILLELAKHSGTAENTLLTVMNASKDYAMEGGKEGASYASVAVNAANSILDRVHGKATQRIEQQSTSVQINVDLTGVS